MYNKYRIIKLVKSFSDGTVYMKKIAIENMYEWFKKIESSIVFYQDNKCVQRRFVDWYIHDDGYPRVVVLECSVGGYTTSYCGNGFMTYKLSDDNPDYLTSKRAINMIGTRPRLDKFVVVDYYEDDKNNIVLILHEE